jgi:15-cis-phytoene synthase
MAQSAEEVKARQLYCREKAAADGSSFYYATLFEPVTMQQPLFALFALHYEITDCLTASPDPGVIRLKLHWWSEELERLLQQQPRHPVTSSLLPLVADQRLTLAPLLNYMTVIESIISGPSIASVDDWLETLATGLGQIWSAAIPLSGAIDEKMLKVVNRNGGLIFILDLLQNYRLLAARGFEFLPSQLLSNFSLQSGEIIRSKESLAVQAMFAAVIERIESELDSCFSVLRSRNNSLPDYPQIMNRIAKALCREISKDGYQLLQHRIALTPLRKFWIACRTRFTI